MRLVWNLQERGPGRQRHEDRRVRKHVRHTRTLLQRPESGAGRPAGRRTQHSGRVGLVRRSGPACRRTFTPLQGHLHRLSFAFVRSPGIGSRRGRVSSSARRGSRGRRTDSRSLDQSGGGIRHAAASRRRRATLRSADAGIRCDCAAGRSPDMKRRCASECVQQERDLSTAGPGRNTGQPTRVRSCGETGPLLDASIVSRRRLRPAQCEMIGGHCRRSPHRRILRRRGSPADGPHEHFRLSRRTK